MAHHHHHNIPAPSKRGRKLFLTIVFNSVITIAEFAGGLITGYLALIADAVHNLSDVASLGLAWLGEKGAELPATKKSTFGFKRVEVMTAMISAVALVVIAVFIIIEAYERLLTPRELKSPWLFLAVAVIGLVGNLLSIWMLFSEKGKSLNMRTAFLHMAYDALSSVVVIAGGVVIIFTGFYQVDVILSVVISLMIFWSSYLVIKEAVMIFLEAVPKGINFDEVAQAIGALPMVNDVHDLHIWSLSSNEIALSCHVCVSEEDYLKGPEIIERVNHLLAERFKIGHGTIQLEKADCPHPDLLCGQNGISERRRP